MVWVGFEPHAGSVAFPRYTGRLPLDQFCEQLVLERSVMIVPGSLFEVAGHFRLGLGRQNLAAGLGELAAFSTNWLDFLARDGQSAYDYPQCVSGN